MTVEDLEGRLIDRGGRGAIGGIGLIDRGGRGAIGGIGLIDRGGRGAIGGFGLVNMEGMELVEASESLTGLAVTSAAP